MTPERLRELILMTGKDRRVLARMMGYTSDNSLRQCLAGRAQLPPDKAAWLEGFARIQARHTAALVAWLTKNPPPTAK